MTTKNIPKIKQVLLAKDTHEAVCGSHDQVSQIMTTFETMFGDFSNLGMLQAAAISKLRTQQSNLKLIRVYGVTIHGLSLVLNRLPNKAARERAAMVREHFGLRYQPVCFRVGCLVVFWAISVWGNSW